MQSESNSQTTITEESDIYRVVELDWEYKKTIDGDGTRFAKWWNKLTAKEQFDAEYPEDADYSDGRDRSQECKMNSFYEAINEGKA